MTREAIVEKLRAEVHAGRPVVGVSAGVGLTAKCAEKGGADLIFLHNAGRFRMSGRSTLLAKFSFGNANDVTEEMVCECLPVLQSAPVVAGVFAQDPFKNVDLILKRLQKLGVAGIQNSPTLGMMKPAMAKNLEAGMRGLSMEYELIRKAHDMGFFTAPIVHSAEQVQPFLDAGADVIVATAGITVGEEDGVPMPSLEENIALFRAVAQEAKRRKADILVLAHGGALNGPAAVQAAFDAVPELDGFVGGSAVERIPVEKAIRKTIQGFKEAGAEK